MQEQEISIFETTQVVYAGFWQRFASSFIDGMILILPGMVINKFIGGGDMFKEMVYQHTISTASIAGELTSTAMYWLYTSLLLSGKAQATVGMMALGLKITDMNGGRISFARASGRYFASILSTLTLLFGYFMMLWDEKNQTLHDKIAGTLIVKKQPDYINS